MDLVVGGVVAIVPARGGSQSIPRKNIRRLAGVPLIAYSIEAGLRAQSVNRVIVSTDDEEIADVARSFGADVPFIRPSALAEADTPDHPVFRHALEWLALHQGYAPEIVVQLRPTSPVRPPGLVEAAVAMLQGDERADSVRGVVAAGQNPYKMWRIGAGGLMTPLLGTVLPEAYNQPRQLLPPTFWQTGHIDAIRARTILHKGSMSGDRILGLEIDPGYACDLDTEADWRRVEWQMATLDAPWLKPGSGAGVFPQAPGLVVFDFDGVFTDNRVWVSDEGREWVACSRSDGIGLARLRALGVRMMVLSTEPNPVVAHRCRKLGIDCEHGVADKATRLRALVAGLGVRAEDVVYVGNDVNDLECLAMAGCAVVPADAHPSVRPHADVVLRSPGGHGAVRELCDLLHAHLTSAGSHTETASQTERTPR